LPEFYLQTPCKFALQPAIARRPAPAGSRAPAGPPALQPSVA